MAWKSPAQTLQEWKDQRARERRSFDPLGRGPASPFNMVRPEGEPGGFPAQQTRYDPLISAGPGSAGPPPPPLESLIRGRPDAPFPPTGLPGQQSTQGVADIFSGGGAAPPAPLIAGPSISDRVRGNRYANMDPREREALNLTIAGELSPYSYGKPVTDQEVANMVETVTTRAAKTGKSIEDTVKDPWQYSPWNTLPDREEMRKNLEAHGPDVRRMVANAVTGDVMPTHEGLTHYLNRDAVRRIPNWATEDKRAAKVGPYHTFYRDVDPYAPFTSQLAAPAPPGAIASRDIPGAPPNTPFDPDAPMVGQAPAVSAGPDLPPPADYVAPPPYTGGPVNAPLTAPQPLTPEQVTAGQQRVDQILDPALQSRPPLVALAEDRATRERAPLIAPPAGVPQTPQPAPAPPVQPAPGAISAVPPPAAIPGQVVSEGPGAPAPAPAPLIAPPAPVSTMRDVALAAREAGLYGRIHEDPSTHILSGFTHGVGVEGGKPWTPEQQAQIAAAVPGITTDAGNLRLTPAAPAPAPLIAPAVTPRRTVTPQTPVSPEPESNLPPLPSASVPPIAPVTPGPAAPETAGMGTQAPLIAPPATTPINPRLSPKEIQRRAEDRGFGTVENLTGDRWARGIGAGIGAAAGLATGNPLTALGLGVQGYRSGDDVRRSYMNRTGPFGILGNIFGMGRGRDKDKKKNDEKYGSMPKDPSASSMPPATAYGGGLGSDRYVGGTYTGQSTGGRYLTEGTGGAFR